jgi:iron complex outermembrane recepter protein
MAISFRRNARGFRLTGIPKTWAHGHGGGAMSKIWVQRRNLRSIFLASTACVTIVSLTGGQARAQSAPSSSPTQTSSKPVDSKHAKADGKPAQHSANHDANDVTQVETVVVVARKYKEDQQNVPIPITTLSKQAIQEKNITSFQQLSQQLPALSFSTTNNKQTQLGIRGIGVNGLNQDGLDPSVGVLVDGVYQPRLGLISNEYVDLAQVEELRGPQGTLFGKNTTAGVILINTQLPSFVRSEMIETDLGEYGTRQYKMNLTGPINDQLAYRFTAYDDRTDGYVTNVQDGLGYLQRNSQGGRAQLLYTPTNDLTVRFIASGDHQDFRTGGSYVFDGYYPASPVGGNLATRAQANGLPFPTQFNSYLASISQYQSTEASTYETSLHVDYNTAYGTLSDISAFNYWQFVPNNNGGQPFIQYTTFGNTNNVTNESEELRWTSPRGKPIEWQTGLYIYAMNLASTGTETLGSQFNLASGSAKFPQSELTGLNTGFHYDIDDNSYAAYSGGTWHVTHQWDLNAGLRETFERKGWNYNGFVVDNPGALSIATINANNLSLGPIAPGTAQVSGASLEYQVGSSYHITNDLMSYVSFSKGEKSAGINQSPLTAGQIAAGGSQILAPEEATNLEIGVKSEWFNHRLLLNATAFNEIVTNFQGTGVYQVPDTNTTSTFIANVGSIQSRGFELDNRIAPFENLNLYGSFAYTDAFYGSYTNGSCPAYYATQVCNFTGRSVPFTPKFYVSETAEYSKQVARNVTVYGLIDGNWRSSQNLSTTLDPYSEISGYLIGDLRVGARFDIDSGPVHTLADISLWVTNFTNAYYFTALTGARATALVLGSPGQPRTFGITLRGTL